MNLRQNRWKARLIEIEPIVIRTRFVTFCSSTGSIPDGFGDVTSGSFALEYVASETLLVRVFRDEA